jgi:AcrR family transcriptional regulator
MSERQDVGARGRGARTREAAQRVALRLFTEQGYEATSLRQIADELGINKASLYYHFDGKEAIVRSLLEQRGDEAEELLAWVREQPPSPQLLADAVLRWVESFTAEKLQGIRFLAANPRLLAGLTGGEEPRVGVGLSRLADDLAELLPERTAETVVLLRMALLSINAAVQAAASTDASDDAVIAAARRAARIVTSDLLAGTTADRP